MGKKETSVMNKSTRNLIIIIGLIVVFVIGIAVVMNIDTAPKEDKKEDSKSDYVVYHADEQKLAKISITTENTSITAENNNGTKTINDLDASETDSSKLDFLFSATANILSQNKIEDNPADLSVYGLDNPSIIINITDSGEYDDKLLIGELSPTLGEYFIISEHDRTVYTISQSKFDTFNQGIDYYKSFDRFLVNVDDVTGITIERNNEKIELAIADDISKTTNDVWQMKAPYECMANDEFIDDTVLASIESIQLVTPLSDGETHGTDIPSATLTLTIRPYDEITGAYSQEYTETLVIGKTDGTTTYVKYNDNIFAVNSVLLDFVNAQAFNFINKLQSMVSVDKVSSVNIKYSDTSANIDIKHGSTANDIDFSLNGANVDNKLAKKIYQAIIGLAVDGIYKDEALGETELAISYKGINSSDDTVIEFKSIDDLSCAVVKNGNAEFIIKKTNLNDFKEAFDAYVQNPNG